jgi:hypothetical protein
MNFLATFLTVVFILLLVALLAQIPIGVWALAIILLIIGGIIKK